MTKSRSKRQKGHTSSPRSKAMRDAAVDRATAGEADPPAIRWGWWLAAAALVLPPLVVLPGALDAVRLPQRLVAEWLALASLIPLAVVAAPSRWRESLRWAAPRAVLPLVALAALGLAWTAHPEIVGDALVDLAIGAAALVVWSLALPVERLRRLLDALLVPAALLALIAVMQLHQLWQPVAFGETIADERIGVSALAGNPGDLAAWLVLPCLVAQASLPGSRGARRFLLLAVAALCLYALVGTRTLTALAAVGAGSVVLWASRLGRRRLLPLGAAVVVGALGLAVLVPPLRERVIHAWQLAIEKGDANALLSGRLDGWRVAVRLLREHPLGGVGFGAYRAEFTGAKLRMLAEGVPFYAGHLNPNFASAHDEYLEVAAELGWPGVVALGWGLGVTFLAARAVGARVPHQRGLVWGGLVAAALLALAYFPFRLAPVALPWVAWLAWLYAAGETEATT
jgi:O-antigen ligase